MQTIREPSSFCIELTLYDNYKSERFIELHHIRDCIFIALSKCDFISGDKVIRVLSVMVDISLTGIDRNVENLVQGIYKLRVGFIQILCLLNLYKEEAAKKDGKVSTKDEKEIIS